MYNYLTKEGEFGYVFDTNIFLEAQHTIAKKYDDIEKLRICGSNTFVLFSARMDNYYARTNGELSEVYRELFKEELNKEEFIKECADIIMYLGSQNYIVYANHKINYSEFFEEDFRFSFPHPFQGQTYDEKLLFTYKALARAQETITKMIDQYQVEWHEKIVEKSVGEILAILESTEDCMIQAMQYVLAVMIEMTNGDVDLINRCIWEKQQRALNR